MSLTAGHLTPVLPKSKNDITAIGAALISRDEHGAPRAFKMAHQLSESALFDLPHLADLACRLERSRIEYYANAEDAGEKLGDETTLSTDDIIDPVNVSNRLKNIERHNGMLVLKNVESCEEYRQFLHSVLYQIAVENGLPHNLFNDIQGFIFIAAPGAATPFQLDAEDNMLLQIKGQMAVHIFDNHNYDLVPQEAYELSLGDNRAQAYEDEFEERATMFDLNLGEGVRIPYQAPHWFGSESDVAISIAVTWKTPAMARNNNILAMNALLRKLGLPQAAPGQNRTSDMVKNISFATLKFIANPLRKSATLCRLAEHFVFARRYNL